MSRGVQNAFLSASLHQLSSSKSILQSRIFDTEVLRNGRGLSDTSNVPEGFMVNGVIGHDLSRDEINPTTVFQD